MKVKNKRVLSFTICGLLILAVTITVFFITRSEDSRTSVYLGFGMIVFSEIILMCGLAGIEVFATKQAELLFRIGSGVTITIYSIMAFISSLIFIIRNTDIVQSFIVVQLILFVAMVILLVAFYTASNSVGAKDNKVLSSVSRIDNMVDSLQILKSNHKYGSRLYKLGENLKCTDISTTVDVDDEIEQKISEINSELGKDKYSEKIDCIIKETQVLIDKRKRQITNKKLGGI